MLIKIITIFPEFFESPLKVSIPARAIEKGLVNVVLYNLRDYSEDKHKKTDDEPFGGGAGLVMKPEPWFQAIPQIANEGKPVIFLTPQGQPLTQPIFEKLSGEDELTLICGRYKGLDERVREKFVTHEYSLGDYVLSGGEPAAMVFIDAVIRLIPGVLNDFESAEKDSFSTGILDHPHYTRPYEIDGLKVPEVLISGHHKNIELWRRQAALKRTFLRRPDLLRNIELSKEDRDFLKKLKHELSET